jgi:tRNA threonylcarbamoyladenosine biosynthesis protein TsaB
MTAVLAIDTADRTAGAAISRDGEVRAEAIEDARSLHSSRLFRLVDAVMDGAGLVRADLSAVAVSRGPGSFTGLRVGVASAKGIGFALGIPVVGVSTLEALARGVLPFPGVVCPILDARKQQVYAGAWDGRTGAHLLPESAWEPSALLERLWEVPGPRILLGSGLGRYGAFFSRQPQGSFLLAAAERWPVSPGQVALLGCREIGAGRVLDPALLVPAYHRLSEAEEKRGGRRGGVGTTK